jgi:hypothetical protein
MSVAVVGAALVNPPVGEQACQGTGCTLTQTSDPAPGFVLAVPRDGTLTSWKAIGGGAVRLRVLRDAGGGAFVGVASSPSTNLDASATAHEVNLPVKAGDRIGVDLDAGSPNTTFESPRLAFAPVDGASYAFFTPALADGASGSPFGTAAGNELQVQATVTTPGGDAPGAPGGGGGGGGGGSKDASACVVPRLRGKTVRGARRALAAAGCALGHVRRRGHARRPVVRAQSERPGAHKPGRTRVDVRVR